ncbi:hypothetical protein [Parasutterella excrementihominis]|uniref:hypothetical protein n=1 Tax=Parasutterella excrementihominis TaxID=487175 RepID=UPI003AAA551D
MTTAGCLNLRGKDGSQSSITVRCVYLPASFFNACSSDYLRTERLFLQRPFASQMVSPVFSHFAAVLLEIRNIAFLNFMGLLTGFKGEKSSDCRKQAREKSRKISDFFPIIGVDQKFDYHSVEDCSNKDYGKKPFQKRDEFYKGFQVFLRVLGLDFCLTAQILPSTPETNFVRMR